MEETSTIECTPEQVSSAIDEIETGTSSSETTDETTTETTETGDKAPESTKEETVEETKTEDNSSDCPQKFLSQDGTPDVQKILEAYKNLESSYTQKTQEYNSKLEQLTQAKEQEQEQIAKEQGFESYEEQQISLVTAQRTAQNYLQYLNYLDSEDQYRVHQLLSDYYNTGDGEILSEIQDNFGKDVVIAVTRDSAIFEDELRRAVAEQKSIQETEKLKVEATQYVENAIENNKEWFNIQPFAEFFEDALKTKGAFDVGAFVNHISNLREYFRQELMNELNSSNENTSLKNSLINQTPVSKTTAPASTFDMKNSSDAEWAREISKYI